MNRIRVPAVLLLLAALLVACGDTDVSGGGTNAAGLERPKIKVAMLSLVTNAPYYTAVQFALAVRACSSRLQFALAVRACSSRARSSRARSSRARSSRARSSRARSSRACGRVAGVLAASCARQGGAWIGNDPVLTRPDALDQLNYQERGLSRAAER